MAKTKFLARDLSIAISTAAGVDTISGTDDDTWTPILGLNSLTHSPSTERATTTGFDNAGKPSHLVAERGDTWELAGFAIVDVANGDKDPGQDAVEASARQFSSAAERFYRITDPAGNKLVFKASAEVTLPGGGHNDAASWGASLEVTEGQTYTPAP